MELVEGIMTGRTDSISKPSEGPGTPETASSTPEKDSSRPQFLCVNAKVCCAIRSCPSGWADANFLLAEVGDAIVVVHIEGEWLWVRTEDGHKGWFPRHAVVHPPIKIEY